MEPPQKPPFLRQLDDRLGERLFDSNLTVTRILRLVFMSRTDLHRKLKREAGMSATEYIRSERLKKARKLLSERPDLPVGRVASEVGFGSQSYFTRKFKEMFGVRPGEGRG
jgi:AraC-like DNA-binding protein